MFPTMMTIRKKSQVIAFHFFFLLLPLPLPAQPGAFPGASEPQLNRNMAVAFVALICAFFLLGLFSVYTRQCTEGRFGRYPGNLPGGQRGVGALPWTRSSRGLDPTFVATFPTFVYSTVKGHKIGKSSLECAVCLNEFESSDTLRLIPKCSHAFHSVCIDAWLVSHTTCPVCRANLIPKPGDASLSLLDLDPSIGSEGSRIRQPENHVSISVAGEESAMERNVINSSQMVSRTPPPRSNTRPTGWRFSGIFQRSNSTGHERFTLRLPEEVRNQLLNSTLKRPRSWTELPGVQSSRQGYRSGTGENGREKKHLARTSSVPAPFFGRAGTGSTPKKDEEDSGERSFAHLRPSGIGPGPGAAAE